MINLVTLHWECRMSVMLVINHSFIIATRFIFRGGGERELKSVICS